MQRFWGRSFLDAFKDQKKMDFSRQWCRGISISQTFTQSIGLDVGLNLIIQWSYSLLFLPRVWSRVTEVRRIAEDKKEKKVRSGAERCKVEQGPRIHGPLPLMVVLPTQRTCAVSEEMSECIQSVLISDQDVDQDVTPTLFTSFFSCLQLFRATCNPGSLQQTNQDSRATHRSVPCSAQIKGQLPLWAT